MTIPDKSIKLGSLFDGIGGFPYAASFFGIETLWASEILPTAISVTKRHFPNMRHVGDITGIHGADLEPADIITFGSPCQGLSLAGQRKGLEDERSGLFSEAMRIIYEMREATNGKYPRFALWENVPGALSTNRGCDYKAVLEAFTKSKVPFPRSGKWANAGMVRSRGVDLAWVIYNAAHFGVAQRRRRIFLVCDFGNRRAGEILFIPKSLRGYYAAGGTPRQTAAAYAARSAHGVHHPAAANCLNGWDTQQARVFTENGAAPTMAGADGGGGRSPAGLVISSFMAGASATARSIAYSEKVSPTLKSAPSGSNMTPCVCEPQTARTLTARGDSSPCVDRGQNIVTVRQEEILCAATGQANAEIMENMAPTIVAGHEQPYAAYGFDKQQITSKENRATLREIQPTLCGSGNPCMISAHPDVAGTLCASGAGLTRPAGMGNETDFCVAYAADQDDAIPIHSKAKRYKGGGPSRRDDGSGNGLGIGKKGAPMHTLTATDQHAVAVDCRNYKEVGGISGTLQAKSAPGYSLNYQNPMRAGYIVRRLTPTECERLQGFPDGWTEYGHDGKPISDSKRYQMLGNSIAAPCAAYIMEGIMQVLAQEEGRITKP